MDAMHHEFSQTFRVGAWAGVFRRELGLSFDIRSRFLERSHSLSLAQPSSLELESGVLLDDLPLFPLNISS